MYSLSTCWNSGRHTCGREMLREIRALGFSYAELSHGIRISLMPGILEAVAAGEIQISTLHNFCPLPMGVNWPAPNLFKFSSEDRRERESAEKHSLKTIETAARLGAKLIVLHSGQVELKDYNEKLEQMVARGDKDSPKYRKLVEEMEMKRERKKERPIELALELIGRLANTAAQEGLLLGIENREAVEEIPFDHDISWFLTQLPENVRYWHDCGHAQIKENLGFIQHSFHLEGLAPRLAGFHIHDVREDVEGQHDHCPPGSGMIRFAELKPWVKPEHIKVVELSPGVSPEDVSRGFAFIKSVWGEE
ncbi:MAG TPA: sugar phosphate isomerase/epimerase [Verrucomicrobiota bacterium]|nr:sugar phosphate isomerase/epimerase [Verrucomicrobiota bacterium]